MGFVASALLEYALMLWMRYHRLRSDGSEKQVAVLVARCRRFDRAALVIFLLAMLSFNLVYWSHFSL